MRRLVIEDCRLPAVDQSIEGRSRVFLSVRLRSEAVVRAVFSWSVPELLQTVLDDFAQEAQERLPILIVLVDRLASIAASGHVVVSTGKLEA